MRKPKKEIQLTSYDELLGINDAELIISPTSVILGRINFPFFTAPTYGFPSPRLKGRGPIPPIGIPISFNRL